jgi:hypothetical protein
VAEVYKTFTVQQRTEVNVPDQGFWAITDDGTLRLITGYYLKHGGDNDSPGTSVSTAFGTFDFALAQAIKAMGDYSAEKWAIIVCGTLTVADANAGGTAMGSSVSGGTSVFAVNDTGSGVLVIKGLPSTSDPPRLEASPWSSPADNQRVIYVGISTQGAARVRFEDITIAKGHIEYSASLGGGILIEGKGASVTLGRGAIVGGSKADGNQANNGGGVSARYGSTLILENGSEISHNIAVGSTHGRGGGVDLSTQGASQLIMSGGSIKNNSAISGGGVSAYSGTFTMSGGEIKGNIASEKGGGVLITNSGVLIKTAGGIIYGYTEGILNPNQVGDGTTPRLGHAVYSSVQGVTKFRDTTVTDSQDLFSDPYYAWLDDGYQWSPFTFLDW